MDDEADLTLIVGYGVAAVLLILYFLCESCICHRSQQAESTYLAAVILLLYFASIFWGEFSSDVEDVRTIVRLHHLMRFMIVLHILRIFVLPKARPVFHGFRGQAAEVCSPTRRSTVAGKPGHAPPSRRAMFKAQELEDLIEEVVEVSSKRTYGSRIITPVLFVLLMLEDLMFAFEPLRDSLEYPLLVTLIMIHLYGVCMTGYRLRQWSQRRSSINDVIADLIHRRLSDILQYVIATTSVGALVDIASWQTFHDLTEQALQLQLLDVGSKAILIAALQTKGMRFNRQVLSAVRSLILSCEGEELTLLKNMLDSSGNYHNLYKLVYIDITNGALRNEILQHLRDEARTVRQSLQSSGKRCEVKIISDIDDTFYSSGGLFPAGCDKRFPRNVLYPGVLKLLQILDRGHQDDVPSCNLVFLSARPHLYKDVTEDKSYGLFHNLMSAGRLHSLPTLLPGRLKPGLLAMSTFPCLKSGSWRHVGSLKFSTYIRYRELYREYDYVFLGDNGQGDLLAAEMMLEEQARAHGEPFVHGCGDPAKNPSLALTKSDLSHKELEPRIVCALIHQVLKDDKSLALYQDTRRADPRKYYERLREQRLFMHSSYVGAALELHNCDETLVTTADLAIIVVSAVEGFDAARWSHHKWSGRWTEAEKVLRHDVDRAIAKLEEEGHRWPQHVGRPQLKTFRELQDEFKEEDRLREQNSLKDLPMICKTTTKLATVHPQASNASSTNAAVQQGVASIYQSQENGAASESHMSNP